MPRATDEIYEDLDELSKKIISKVTKFSIEIKNILKEKTDTEHREIISILIESYCRKITENKEIISELSHAAGMFVYDLHRKNPLLSFEQCEKKMWIYLNFRSVLIEKNIEDIEDCSTDEDSDYSEDDCCGELSLDEDGEDGFWTGEV